MPPVHDMLNHMWVLAMPFSLAFQLVVSAYLYTSAILHFQYDPIRSFRFPVQSNDALGQARSCTCCPRWTC